METNKSENLMQGLLNEIQRCVELKAEYDAIPQGKFGSIMIQQVIDKAKASIAENDVVKMLVAYNELKECK